MFDVVGSLCENNDKFAVDRHLDPVPRPGDVLVLHDSGAHGHSMGFNYNGKCRSAEYLYREDGSVLQIRRKETIEDLFGTIDFGGLAFFDTKNSLLEGLGKMGFVGASAQSKRRAFMGLGIIACSIASMALLRPRK